MFFRIFLPHCQGQDSEFIIQKFRDFYNGEFKDLGIVTKPHPIAFQLIKKLIALNYKVVIATNPLFSELATHIRLEWVKLDQFYDKFALVTNSENCRFAKPTRDYYQEILEKINSLPEECIMVGNDLINDGSASSLGIKFYYVVGESHNNTSFLDDESKKIMTKDDVNIYYQGSLNDLYVAVNQK